MSFQRIEEIVKDNYKKGLFRDCRFRMSKELLERVKIIWKGTQPDFVKGLFGMQNFFVMTGIPIVIDDSLSNVQWIMETLDGSEMIETGEVDPPVIIDVKFLHPREGL